MWRVAKCNKVKWSEWSKVKWNEAKWSAQYREGGRVFMEKVYRSSKWWEVKDWGESVSELVIRKKKQLQETEHSTVLIGCFYFCTCCKILICLASIVASFKVSCV